MKGIVRLAKTLWHDWNPDNAQTMAATDTFVRAIVNAGRVRPIVHEEGLDLYHTLRRFLKENGGDP